MHLADAFIQSNLHCIQGAFYQFMHSLEIEPMTLMLLLPSITLLSYKFLKSVTLMHIYIVKM